MSKAKKFVTPEWAVRSPEDIIKLLKGPHIYAYLALHEKLATSIKTLKTTPTAQFINTVTNMVTAYVQKGTLPPEAIAPAIYNIADDIISGRNVTIKAGDYICIQNYLRSKK